MPETQSQPIAQNWRERALELMESKDSIEAEITALAEDLSSPGAEGAPPAGIKGSLVDNEGFPRADIDCYAVRNKRQRLNCLQTDHRQLMKQIEEALTHVNSGYASVSAADRVPLSSSSASLTNSGSDDVAVEAISPLQSSQTPPAAPATTPIYESTEQMIASAFALVNEVAPGGPAEQAGLLKNDLVLKVGEIDFSNHRNLAAVGQLIQSSSGQAVPVLVVRELQPSEHQQVQVSLTPQPWSGRGLLGCHLLPR
jgi:26S proteasome non-ATPase regulatory subunit 9